jgi:RNA polymerase sigma factor (sigma-70 family)
MNDWRLIREYLDDGSETAFAKLVNRYVDLVYSVALRKVGNPHDAEEITQTVFCQLAQKVRRLPSTTIITSWLYHAACLQSLHFLRTERRRRQRETEVAHMNLSGPETEARWQEVAPHLDAALGGIGEQDRIVILQRFFQRQSLREVGGALGVSEDAARMRVNRALEKLRDFLAREGVACSAAMLTVVLSERAVHAAPPVVVQSVQSAVLATLPSSGVLSLGPKLASIVSNAKLATAIFAGLAISVTVGVVLHFQNPREPVTQSPEATAAADDKAPEPGVNPPQFAPAPFAAETKPELADLIANLRKVLREERIEVNGVTSTDDLFAALKAFGPDLPAAIPALLEGLQDPTNTVKYNSQAGFLRLGRYATEAIPSLLALARDENQTMATRGCAVNSLRALTVQPDGAAAVATAMPDLIGLLKSDHARIQADTAWLMTRLAMSGYAREAIPDLIRLLTNSTPINVAKMESQTGQPGGTDEIALRKEMEEQARETKRYAIQALGCFGADARDAVPMLCEFLQNQSVVSLRIEAARALQRMGPDAQAAVPILKERLADPNRETRIVAAMALWRIAHEADGPIHVLANSIYPYLDEDDYLIKDQLKVLGEMGPAAMAAVPNLVKLSKHPTAVVRESARAALEHIDPDAASSISWE